MYFVSQKRPKNAYLIGLHDHSIYAIGEEQQSGNLVVYRKNVLNAGEWDETIDLNLSIFVDYKCKYCDENKKSFACGIVESKLWIMAAGKKITRKSLSEEDDDNGPHIFCIDLETKEVTNYATQPHGINKFLQQICYECNTLQITFEDKLLGKPRFMVVPNRLQSNLQYLDFSQFSQRIFTPFYKSFYFTIDETTKICEFGYFENLFHNTKQIFQAGIVGNSLQFGFQLLMFMEGSLEQLHFRGDYHRYPLTNYIKTEDFIYARFYRNEKNELCCIIKEKFGSGEDCETLFKLNIYKVDINVQNETASFEFKSSFFVDNHFCEIDARCLIFTSSNTIAFSTEENEFVIIMNRMLTLSEAAFLTLQKISYSFKKSSWVVDKFKDFFQEIHGSEESEKNKKRFGVSLKYLKDYCGIPKNLEIKHGVNDA